MVVVAKERWSTPSNRGHRSPAHGPHSELMLSATAMFPSIAYLVQAEGMQFSDGVGYNWIDGLKAFTKKMKNVVE